ncbi:enoyl-CoA hydratase-related protein [Gordonia sp. (in: high G+C Gram-positive bacteria)]|jgi:2-(1,2-epoxy-1,2-dihydrophenyl)acetyl-CoA isomerase|uniref:enoyl-CoA hydratase-related protein n=1 Tax=Gordonia sp. (in: high G+C Gram-positive bacteria) TaxID=84139 RepID=UPI001D8DACE2|nr:enoyl-CoA hydratase-related protein [Gordonia sp. (in: high G+C Gram-positive bacteria)]MCB1296624.1 enoyl-CoA hydratase/isomerase family protein [Gordonia sp. (in: high G+C Gram-positive bacteria)]HMS75782.1 enoyl-CoA hydratase-related protein [Gordonia sp. (in: high G+C Gram-positive bacteria)]HQV18134.1 enoyl-CoA hydratase-related protein [Gordonia sp. (in: high G+C Gram-positive bacteria)]
MAGDVAPQQVSVAQTLYTALAGGDADRVRDLLDTEFVGRTAPGLPLGLGGTYHGPDDMIGNFWWRLGRTFRARAEPESFDLLPDNRLQVCGTYRGICRPTGRELNAEFIHILTFAESGKITRLRQLTDTAIWCDAFDGGEVTTFPGYSMPTITELETIEYSVEHGVAQVIINRPEHRNAINLRMAEETLAVARAIEADPRVRAVLIAGNGQALSVGGDIDYFTSALPGTIGALTSKMTEPFHECFRILDRLDVPIVTAAHGSVAGGGLGFVYAADITVAAAGTVFCTAFSAIGLSGDGGGTWSLPRLIGPVRARRMYLENLRVDAELAEQWGLVAEVVDADTVREYALSKARKLAAGPTRGFALQRKLLRESVSNTLSEQLRAETDGLAVSGKTRDAQQAIEAFISKKPPTFEGR